MHCVSTVLSRVACGCAACRARRVCTPYALLYSYMAVQGALWVQGWLVSVGRFGYKAIIYGLSMSRWGPGTLPNRFLGHELGIYEIFIYICIR